MPVAETCKNIGKSRGRPKKIDEALLRQLVAAGKKDVEIASELGVAQASVTEARQRLGLAPNAGRGRPKSPGSESRRRQKALPDDVQGRVRVMVGLGYAPAEVADRLGLRRSDVMRFLRGARGKRWPGLYEALPLDAKEEFLRWRYVVDGARAALPGSGTRAKLIPFDLGMIRLSIQGTRLELNRLPWWERFPLHPEVLRRLGIPNAYRVALEMDARAVSLSTYIDLLISQLYREAWGSVNEATNALDPAARECALAYLDEEIRDPFFADELPDMMRPVRDQGAEMEGRRTFPVDVLWSDQEDLAGDEEIAEMMAEEAEEKAQVCGATTRRRGKEGGKRRRRIEVL